jgi:hypothetical protein
MVVFYETEGCRSLPTVRVSGLLHCFLLWANFFLIGYLLLTSCRLIMDFSARFNVDDQHRMVRGCIQRTVIPALKASLLE